MAEFFESIFPLGALTILVTILYICWSVCKFVFVEVKDYLLRPPPLSKEETEEICLEASEFVHSKHRPWDLDDTFAEYLWITNELCGDREYLKGFKKNNL